MDVYQRRRLVALSAIAVVFILFVLLIRSCGGDDEPTTATPLAGATGTGVPTSLTQADYVAQADQICLEANTSLDNVDESDPVQADSAKAQIVAGELQQLQTLPPPDAGTEDLDKFLSELQKQTEAYQDRSTAQERADDAAVAELNTTLEDSQAAAEKAGGAFGFQVCGDLSKVGEVDTSGGGGGGGGGGGTETTTDTGGTVTPTEPVTPTTTTPVPVAPPTEGGTVTPTPTAPPADDGTDDGSSSGGVSP